jgi:hypothetical protein
LGAAAFSVLEIDCELPEIVIDAVKVCAPVPRGNTIPGDIFTVKTHCVLAGVIEPFGHKAIVKVPVASSVVGPTVPWMGI